MQALRFHAFGPPTALSLEDVPTPEPRTGEVLVRIHAAGINPSDVKNVAGWFPATSLPRTPGRDFAGVIAHGPRQGEAVWSSAPGLGMARDGVHADYAAVPASALAPLPQGLSFAQAAALGVPYTTAWAALMQTAQLAPGETVLLVGAAGAVGQAAAQITRWQQARVLGADLRDDIPNVDAALNTAHGSLTEWAREQTAGRGADVVFDMVGGALFESALRSLRPAGRQVAITSTGQKQVSFNLVDFYHNESRLFGLDSNHFTPAEVGAMAAALAPGFASGALRPPAIETHPLAQARTAYERAATAGAKQVLTLS